MTIERRVGERVALVKRGLVLALLLLALPLGLVLAGCGGDGETTTVTVTETVTATETGTETTTEPSPEVTAAVVELQNVMTSLGYYDGPIDGDYGEATTDAV